MDCNAETTDIAGSFNSAVESTRTIRDLAALRTEERLRDVLNLPPPPPTRIHGPGKRSAEETARLIADLESKIATQTTKR
jgi:hypothetical protein